MKLSQRRSLRFALVALLTTLVFLLLPAQGVMASWWHDLTDSQRNALILDEAQDQIGEYGGSCKVWVQNLVYAVSAYDLWLPQNITDPEDDYYLAAWRDDQAGSPYCDVVWQGNDYCPARFDVWGLQPGNIIQIRHTAGGTYPHTFIVEVVYQSSLQVIDSNWGFDGEVTRHTISINWWSQYVEAWTAYQIE